MNGPALVVVLLGASRYPSRPDLTNDMFRKSCIRFRGYATVRLGARVLDLFDSPDSPGDLVTQIQEFLAENTGSDVLVYFVGHGARTSIDGPFALFTAVARQNAMKSTAFSADYLVEATREAGRTRRIHFLLDACFSGAATQNFTAPMGSAGVAILASASSDDSSSSAGDGATVFTAALMDVLERGDRGYKRRLSLRNLRDLIVREIGHSEVRPELHSPQQREGDAADLELFPNAAYDYEPAPEDGNRPWCSVVASSDAGRTFAGSVERFSSLSRREIDEKTGWSLRELPTEVRAADVFIDTASFERAVTAVCEADLAFFDLTDMEPAVLVLLGIRAVIRRGVTICSTAEDSTGLLSPTPPFLLRDINVVRHGAGTVAQEWFRRRAVAGILDFIRAPHRYADLPGFDAVRQPRTGRLERSRIPFDERVLVLCSFDPGRDQNWEQQLSPSLKAAVAGRSTRSVNTRIERTLEMVSARLVSANLFEAIRFTDFCLCDLTGWRPNVLFELGMRIAANPIEPVCVLEIPDSGAEGIFDVVGQRSDLVRTLGAREYDLANFATFQEMVDRHRELVRVADERRLTQEGVYWKAWQHADPVGETAANDVVRLLQHLAADLVADRTSGESPLIFPPGHALVGTARTSAIEALVAAWFYMRHRWPASPGQEQVALLKTVGYQLTELLGDSADEADQRLAGETLDHLDQLEGAADGA
ncbi:caspase family protein [Winogradskya humida]|uniref:Peptidase C14 caspase domain-containing protein n=1 Tax=Winogradskya humida TaxID=113566 RepID=A0ABQ3ZKF6_9ACTN|nr:caspase family protein [Actinoplanes humidus]GIE18682.1 hypothetical protein Ahu01nite_017840 [Actinoplanes humidus]